MEHEIDVPEGAGDPAQAFKNLRAELADVRRAVATLPQVLAANRPPAAPD